MAQIGRLRQRPPFFEPFGPVPRRSPPGPCSPFTSASCLHELVADFRRTGAHFSPDIVADRMHAAIGPGQDVLDVVGQDHLFEVLVAAVPLDESLLVVPRAGRAAILVAIEVIVPAADAVLVVDAAAVEVPAIVGPERIVSAMPVKIERGVDAEARVRTVPVAEVIMAITRPHEEVNVQPTKINHAAGAVVESRPDVDRPAEVDRGEAHAPIHELVVPVAGHVDAAVRCPVIMRRHPHPAVVPRRPVARPPEIIVAFVFPATVDPEVIVRGGWAGRALFETLWGRGQVFYLLGLDGRPEPGHPLMPVVGLAPIAGDPALTRRKHAVNPGNPDIVLALVVPGPVARNPRGVFVGLDFRRHLRNRLGRRLGHDEPRLRIKRQRFRKRLVKRPPQQVFLVSLRRCRNRFLRNSLDAHPCQRQNCRRHYNHGSLSTHCPILQTMPLVNFRPRCSR